MRLHLLGVSGPFPESGGATSGYLLEAGNTLLQLDFGAGILSRLTALTPPEELDALLLSHWHYDHTSDLLPLIYRLESVHKTLRVFAPADGASPLRAVVAASACFELTDVAPGDALTVGSARILVTPARHPVPAVGYRVEEGNRVFGYTGDTNTLPGLAEAYRGCDLLLADGLFPEAEWEERKPHLSAALAAKLAAEAGAGRLVLTHLNPVFPPAQLLREARAYFPDPEIAAAGAAPEL